MNDRYMVSGLHEARRQLTEIEEVDQSTLGNLLAAASRSLLHSSSPPSSQGLPFRVDLSSSDLGVVGQMLADLEVEIRRAASCLRIGSTRPLRERGSISLYAADRNGLLVSISGTIYDDLVATPLDLVLAISWFWGHRLNHTKHRAVIFTDEDQSLVKTLRSAQSTILLNRPSVVTMRVGPLGRTDFEFRER